MAGETMRSPGQVIDVSEGEGQRLIAAKFAIPIEYETASIEPVEKAVKPKPRRKKV